MGIRWNRRLLTSLLAGALLLGVAGCGGTKTETPSAQPAPAPAPAAEKKVTITWWHQWTGEPEAKWKAIADAYMKEHSNVTIEISVLENEAFKQKIATAMQSGKPPHLFQSWGGGGLREYVKAGLVKDISADLQKNGWLDTIAGLDMMAVDGKYYGVPVNVGMVGFWYNKELFSKAGIAAPPKTWDELLTDVQKLKAAGITPIALGEGEKWPGAFWWEYLALRLGGKEAFQKAYTRSGGKFTDAPFVEAGKKLQELTALKPFQDGFMGATFTDESTLVGSGRAAMDLMGHWGLYSQRDNSPDKKGLGEKLGWFPFPSVAGGKGDPTDALGGGDAIAVGKDAPAEAIDFLRFLTKADSLKDLVAGNNIVPTTKGTETGITDPVMKELVVNKSKAKYLQLYYDQFLPPASGAAVNDNVQNLFGGTMTPEQAAQAIEAAAAADLK